MNKMIPTLLKAIQSAVSSLAAMFTAILARLDSLLAQQLSQSQKLDQIIATQKQDASAEQSELQTISGHFTAFQAGIDEILAAVVPSPTASIEVLITKDGQTSLFFRTGDPMQTSQFRDDQAVFFTLANPKDKLGQPAQIDPSKTTFAVDNPAVAKLTPDSILDPTGAVVPGTPGMQCVVQPVGVGTAVVSGTVTDLNNPTDTITFQGQINVTPGGVASIDVQFSQPLPA